MMGRMFLWWVTEDRRRPPTELDATVKELERRGMAEDPVGTTIRKAVALAVFLLVTVGPVLLLAFAGGWRP